MLIFRSTNAKGGASGTTPEKPKYNPREVGEPARKSTPSAAEPRIRVWRLEEGVKAK